MSDNNESKEASSGRKNPDFSETIASYVEQGTTYEDNLLSHVPYGTDDPKQAIDIYFPDSVVGETTSQRPVPVYVHIHGGGWSRGNKASPFYGGPALCQNAAAKCGWIAVSIGYRLGKYPDFMHDCAQAILWVKDHIEEFGGDLQTVVLSGHSAGGHIASLLMLRHSCFLEPVGIPVDFFSGLILVSGVYDLFNPLRAAPIDVKNKWFLLAYVLPAFGYGEKLRREASPLLLLNPDKQTSPLGTLTQSVLQRTFSRTESGTVITSEPDAMQEDAQSNPEKRPSLLDKLGQAIRRSSSRTQSSTDVNHQATEADEACQEDTQGDTEKTQSGTDVHHHATKVDAACQEDTQVDTEKRIGIFDKLGQAIQSKLKQTESGSSMEADEACQEDTQGDTEKQISIFDKLGQAVQSKLKRTESGNSTEADEACQDDTQGDTVKQTSIFDKLGQAVQSKLKRTESGNSALKAAGDDANHDDNKKIQINTSNLPRTLLLNATFDMGLQENGELMARELEKYTEVKHVLVQGTNHADICWHEKSTEEIGEFLFEITQDS